MTLTYANGKGYYNHYNQTHGGRVDYLQLESDSDDFYFPATAPLSSETHGGDDVIVYASGPWAHLFTGNMEQNAIPHLMAYAACVGDGLKACDEL
jgi:alkaline phosphatase